MKNRNSEQKRHCIFYKMRQMKNASKKKNVSIKILGITGLYFQENCFLHKESAIYLFIFFSTGKWRRENTIEIVVFFLIFN